MPVVRVLRHGQITLPKEFREALGVKGGYFRGGDEGKSSGAKT